MPRADWLDTENDIAVASYFNLLAKDLSGLEPVKAVAYREVSKAINRSPKSIEFKFQNISAVVEAIGAPWILGLPPRRNYQSSLEDAVERWLGGHEIPEVAGFGDGLAETQGIVFRPPPTLSNRPPPTELERMRRTAVRFDAAGRDARNRKLGEAGERLVLSHERSGLRARGREDLADLVTWTSNVEGDGAGYDISSFDENGRRRLIEVKSTRGSEWTPFHISRNELAVSNEIPDAWCLVRLWNLGRKPEAFELRPPLDRHVSLIAESYLAQF